MPLRPTPRSSDLKARHGGGPEEDSGPCLRCRSSRDRYLDVPRLRCEVGVPLGDQPGLGHNRWHPDIPPAIEIGPGEEVILESPAYDDYHVARARLPSRSHRTCRASGSPRSRTRARSASRPRHELMQRWFEREQPLFESGRAFAPDARNALLHGLGPDQAAVAARTQPPRENGGNMDINKLGPGAKVYFPVFVDGALLRSATITCPRGTESAASTPWRWTA